MASTLTVPLSAFELSSWLMSFVRLRFIGSPESRWVNLVASTRISKQLVIEKEVLSRIISML